MFWADKLAKEITERFAGLNKSDTPIVIRDEKTPSGRIHIGSMRGVAIHGVISEALTEQGVANTFLYEFNDMDAMDGFPQYLPEEFRQYMGMPLRTIPSPDGKAKNFAEYFAEEFKEVIRAAGFTPEFYNVSELYFTGKMDEVVRIALEHAADIRRVYKEVSGSQKPDDWYPLSVICENCGKVGTTKVYAFDGEKVSYRCEPHMVTWAEGCGHEGTISPFGGNAKFPFKVEWPAKWRVMGVMVEGAGKDHSTKGGARDVAAHIAKEVFNYEPPFDTPYEFFLVGGKKMSSSKGRGSSAKEISELVPAKILRLTLLGKDINQAINFDPEGDTIPVLYDLYDKLAEGYTVDTMDDYARLFELIHPGRQLPAAEFYPRFSQVAFLVQMPHLDLEREIAVLKGSELTHADKKELEERVVYAKKWLAEYAPEKFVFTLQDDLPEAAKNLSAMQKKALAELQRHIAAAKDMPTGEDIQHTLHEIKEALAIAPQELFGALYLSFLGKSYGPKIGWFLSVLDKEFVLRRLQEASA
ncbi:MAG TPA: lysine--tRNA ligase [Candidatus Paceibacterota bacterium]